MRKKVRGRFFIACADADMSYRVESLKEKDLTPREVVEHLRHYADFIEKHFCRAPLVEAVARLRPRA